MTKLWGSRFKKSTDPLADQFTYSISYDATLAYYDVVGSIAHAKMLGKTGILSKKDSQTLVQGLKKLAAKIKEGKFAPNSKTEDIHTAVQEALKKLVGDVADKLHTARSRNDQIVLDLKLYCRDKAEEIKHAIADLQKALVLFAQKNSDIIIPAYTHLQSAQVVLLAHHLLAYVEMFERDKTRLDDAQKRLNVLPLGSCALSGTSLPIDRSYTAKQLAFAGVSANSMDAVSDRDFAIELIAALSICATHLSRLAEDLILWNTTEFNFIDIDWAYCTGSSIMPHKKNPDVLELIRATSASIYGDLVQLLTLMKGLPLTYNRDLQLDKPPLFHSINNIQQMLPLITKIVKSARIKPKGIAAKVNNESFFSVDIMEYLIKKGVSYRQAHDIVGKMVKECLDKGKSIMRLSLAELKKFSPKFGEDVKKLLNPKMSVKIKASFGSTNPQQVKKQLQNWKKKLHA